METKDLIPVIFGSVNATIFIASGVIAYVVYRWNDTQKKKDRALDLYKSLMTGEFLVKARLVSQEYLLEDPRSEKYKKFGRFNYEELDIELQKPENSAYKEDRFYLRAIPNFFHTVNLAWKHDYLLEHELILSEMYCWYWVFIIRDRRVPGNEMFQEHVWMRRDSDVKQTEEERKLRRHRLGIPDQPT